MLVEGLVYVEKERMKHLSFHSSFIYDFLNNGALRDDEDIESTTKRKAQKIDSVFIIFRLNDKRKIICIQPFITDFKLTAEHAGVQMYPTCGIVMNTWNDSVQFQMLLDELDFRNNAMVRLTRKFINRCKVETVITAPVENGLVTTAIDILKQDPINFLIEYLFSC
jgi:hypothetical protein